VLAGEPRWQPLSGEHHPARSRRELHHSTRRVPLVLVVDFRYVAELPHHVIVRRALANRDAKPLQEPAPRRNFLPYPWQEPLRERLEALVAELPNARPPVWIDVGEHAQDAAAFRR